MCTSVHMSIHGVVCMNVRSMCMTWFVCMHRRNLFLAKHGFQTCVVQSTLLKVEPKQSILLFSKQKSFSIMEEEVHVIGMLDDEVTVNHLEGGGE